MQTTEELKREMYGAMQILKSFWGKSICLEKFESAFEAYLEELRKDLNFACRTVDVTDAQLGKTLRERDDLRNRLQAFEFANKVCGEELLKAQALIKRQRETIGKLYMAKKALQYQGSTSAQDSVGSASETICGPFYGQCQHSFRNQYAFPNGKIQKQCVFCMLTIEA